MWWPATVIEIGPDTKAYLDRLLSLKALEVETLTKNGKAMSALTDAAKTLVDEVAEIIADVHEDQQKIADLTAQLAAALAANDPAEANAVTAQLTQAAADLKTTLDALHPPAPPSAA